MSSTANKRLFVDANAMKHRLEAHIAAVRYKGIKDIPTSYESSNPTEYLRGYERGAIETANLALGHLAVDAVEVVHGRWVGSGQWNHKPYRMRNKEKWQTYLCSVCGHSNGRRFNDNYCPNCGAKMDGDGNG